MPYSWVPQPGSHEVVSATHAVLHDFLGMTLCSWDLCSRGTQLEPFVVTSVLQLLCRTTKLCWYDDDVFRNIVEDAKRFLDKVSRARPGNKTVNAGWPPLRCGRTKLIVSSTSTCFTWNDLSRSLLTYHRISACPHLSHASTAE